MYATCRAIALAGVFSLGAAVDLRAAPSPSPAADQTGETPAPGLVEAQRLFFTGRYEDAAAIAAALRSSEDSGLMAYELRNSAVLFQIRRALGEPKDKEKALAQCMPCPALMADFRSDLDTGRELARTRLKADPQDTTALFILGKLNLNYVWLQLGTLGRRTGWNEYWEARHSLDDVIKRQPSHVRGRVARAWIDYIVDTRMPWGTEWMLGGGDKKRALKTLREAALTGTDAAGPLESFDRAEATFALWEMQVREKNFKEAIVAARLIAAEFPENPDIARFLMTHDTGATPIKP